MTTRDRLEALSKGMDEAVEGLTALDAQGLESLEARIRAVTAEYRAHGMAESRETLPELLRKHTLLRALLKATASNLKVMESVLDARRNKGKNRRDDLHGYLDITAQSVDQRIAGGRDRAERYGK
jgi:hypothetical protein